MLARKHKLKIGEVGIVGYVAAQGKPRIALDVGDDAVFFTNPDLPLTRSEMALPLIVRQQIIGVLDVQSTQAQAFSQEDIDILQILADQIALAIENARLLDQSQRSYQEIERLYRTQVRQGWRRYLQGSTNSAQLTFAYSRSGGATKAHSREEQAVAVSTGNAQLSSLQVRKLEKAPSLQSLENQLAGSKAPHAATQQAGQSDEPDSDSPHSDQYTINLPIQLRGERLGSLVLRRENDASPWQEEETALLQQTLAQLALALENARLLEEVQRRAGHEEMINRIIGKVQSSLNLDSVMRTAAQEIGRSLSVSKVQIRLGSNTANTDTPDTGQHGMDNDEIEEELGDA